MHFCGNYEVEHHFIMLIVYCTVSVNFLFLFLVQFVSRLFVFFLLICKNFLFIKESLHLSVTYCKYFLPVCHMPFSYILPPEVLLFFYVIQLVNFSLVLSSKFHVLLRKHLSKIIPPIIFLCFSYTPWMMWNFYLVQ